MSLSIMNAVVFDGESEVLVDGPVHVENGRVVDIGGSFTADRVLDARGGTVLPD